MSLLLKEIKTFNSAAARELERADLRTDSDLQSLTREDLNELFRGSEKFKLRKNISDIIHRQKPINALLKDLKHFIPDESLKAALTENGVLNDYLLILRDLKTQMTNVQTFLDAHIDLLEEYTKNPNQKSDKGFFSDKTNTSSTSSAVGLHTTQTNAHLSGTQGEEGRVYSRYNTSPESYQGGVLSGKTNTSSTSPAVGLHTTQTNAHLSRTQGEEGRVYSRYNTSPESYQRGVLSGKTNTSSTNSASGNYTRPLAHLSQGEEMSGSFTTSSPEAYQGVHAPGLATVTVQAVVCGQTFGSHKTLLDRIKDQSGLNLVESSHSEYSQDCQIVIVFCPISSRPVPDVEAAMSDIRDDKPVILVMMNHTHNANYVTAPRTTWSTIKQEIVLDVNVLYHDMHGLLSCTKNERAVSQIRSTLLNYSSQSSSGDGGNGQGAGAGSVSSGSIGRGGGNGLDSSAGSVSGSIGNNWGSGAGSVSGSIGHGGGNGLDSGAGSVSGSIGNGWRSGAGSGASSGGGGSIGHGGGNGRGNVAGSGGIGHSSGGNDTGSDSGSRGSGSTGGGFGLGYIKGIFSNK
ncbi:uncharacterized protein LOC139913750 [Centroberyx gerrardi]